jgi:soluble lytic murein transglycosylase
MSHRLLHAAAVSLTLFAAATAAAGELYRTIEPDGTIAFTNVPSDQRFKAVPSERPTRGIPRDASHLAPVVARHSSMYEVDPALVWAVMKAESDFDPKAVSPAGAVGLMQLMPETAQRLAVDPYDPEDNIAGGTRYLRYLLDRFRGNLPLALAAYNAGATRVEASRALPAIDETRRYVAKVLRFYRRFAQTLPGRAPQTAQRARPTWVDTLTLSPRSR